MTQPLTTTDGRVILSETELRGVNDWVDAHKRTKAHLYATHGIGLQHASREDLRDVIVSDVLCRLLGHALGTLGPRGGG